MAVPHKLITVWATTAAAAGFLFGFDTAVISGAEQAVQRTWSLSDTMHGLAISSALWGTVVGSLLGGWPSDRFGRKRTLVGIGLLYLVSAIGTALAWDPWSFMAFRLLGGVAIGASSIAAPGYIAEIAPPAWRGRLVAMFQMMIVVGILVAFVSNLLLAGTGAHDWRWMLGTVAIPSAIFLAATLFVPESPRWLLARGDAAEARRILTLCGTENVDAMIGEISAAHQGKAVSLARFFGSAYRRPIQLAFLIALFNQLSGINAILYYAPRIFELTGSGANVSLLATVGIGVINLVFTLVGLALIDTMGRRTLMLIGSLGYIVSLGLVAYGFAAGQFALVLPFIFAFIAAHAIGQGAVIWVYISEIFPTEARASGQALGTGTHWVLAALLTLVMPGILATVPPAIIFGSFAALMGLQLLWVIFMMVETRGQSLEALSRSLVSKG